jgi:choline dehydrogenase-like flavoprotein
VDWNTAITEFILKNCGTICHPVGTAKMGPDSDPQAVVDQYCCVRGVDGLRVVDASVMPNIVRANTNLTCIMIGERVAGWCARRIDAADDLERRRDGSSCNKSAMVARGYGVGRNGDA